MTKYRIVKVGERCYNIQYKVWFLWLTKESGFTIKESAMSFLEYLRKIKSRSKTQEIIHETEF